MPLVLIALALALLLAFSAFIWLAFGLIGLLLHLFMAGLVGALADAIVPGRLPWGWLGAILAGLAGSWLGVLLIGHRGPVLGGRGPRYRDEGRHDGQPKDRDGRSHRSSPEMARSGPAKAGPFCVSEHPALVWR